MVKSDSPPGTIDALIFFTFDLNESFFQIVLDYLDNRDNTYIGTNKLTDNSTIFTLYRDGIKPIKYKEVKFEKDYMKWQYE